MKDKEVKNKAVDILKMKYEVHCTNLEWRENYNMKLISGFATLHIVLGGWLSQNPLSEISHKIAFSVFVIMLTYAVAMLFCRNYKRRNEVVNTILSINRALKFSEPGIYWEEELDPPDKPKLVTWKNKAKDNKSKGASGKSPLIKPAIVYWRSCYFIIVYFFTAAQMLMIWWPV